jgi:hypothetical protein
VKRLALALFSLTLALATFAQTSTTSTTTTTTTTTTSTASAATLSTDGVFADLIAKNPTTPPASDLTVLYLASKAGAQVPVATKAEFINTADATRTDVQLGAAPNSPASTTLVEKPAAADILSLALERGAVSSTADGTALTLSTTPYLIGGFLGVRDSPQNWRDYAALRHIALSATFANGTAVQQQGNFSSIDSGEIKWTILGNRSPRDVALLQEFQPLLDPGILADITKNTACKTVTTFPSYVPTLIAVTNAPKPATPASARAAMDAVPGNTSFTAEQTAALASCAASVVAAQNAFNGIAVQMGALTDAYLKLNQAHQLAIAGSAHRDATIDDYTTIKLLYANATMPKLTLNLNGEADFNQHPESKKLHSLRSFAVELGSTIGRFNEGRFDATISGKLWRNNDTANRNVGVFQLKGDLYLANALALPVSISFASQPVETIRKGWQINLGIASLLDAYLTQSFKNPH